MSCLLVPSVGTRELPVNGNDVQRPGPAFHQTNGFETLRPPSFHLVGDSSKTQMM
jgi:hypothetical protein